MTEGYCTVEDVRRTLQDAELTGALAEDDERAVVQAITAQSEWLRATTGRHWYEPDGIEEDTHDLVPTELKSRDGEEHDIGDEGIPGTVRDAVSMRAAAKLVIDDEASISIPDNGQLVNVQTKAQQWREAAEDLLEDYR